MHKTRRRHTTKKLAHELEGLDKEMALSSTPSNRFPAGASARPASPGLAHSLRRDPLVLIAFLIVWLLIAYQLVVTLLQPPWIGPVTDWLRAALAWPEMFIVFFVSLQLTHTNRPGARSWWMFSLGLLSFAFARTLYTIEDQFIFAGHVPFPAWTDLFFVLQYPFFLLAALFLPGGRLGCSWLKLILDSLLVLGAGAAVSCYFLLVPLYLHSQASLLGKLVILGYPVGDLVILFGLTVTLLYRQNQTARAGLFVLIVAFLCLFIADSSVAWLILYHISFQAGSPPDLFWSAFYLLIPLAGLVWLRSTRTQPTPTERQEARARLELPPQRSNLKNALQFLAPFAAALLASAVIGVRAITAPVDSIHPLVPGLMIFGLLLLVFVRQGITLLENSRLEYEREEARAHALSAQAREQALQEANDQLETFLGMASHELKTPLTSISMGLELIQRRIQRLASALTETTGRTPTSVEPVRALAETTLQQTERLNRLVNDLLDTSRIQAGRLELQIKPVDLAAIARAMVTEQRQAAPGRTILLHVPPEGSVVVCADAERVGQVITNYLTNALKYSDEDRPVEVGVHIEGQHGRVWVRDQGPGIPPREQERLWERFHRVPGIEVRSGSGIGLGLGLHISKTIVESQHGWVGVESVPGQGSTFWFNLPLAKRVESCNDGTNDSSIPTTRASRRAQTEQQS